MKICSRCKQQLPANIDYFLLKKEAKDGFSAWCRKCFNDYKQEWRKKFPAKNSQSSKNWATRNREHYNKLSREWYSNNRDYANNKNSAYRAKQQRAMLKDNTLLEQMKIIYRNCPPGCHVDHIIPLTNDYVCGLHVPWNLQYLTVHDNTSKGNKFMPYKEKM